MSTEEKIGLVRETNKEYHSNFTAISKSSLAKMSICPEYFKWCEENPQEPTDDLILGTAFHKLVLEPDEFDNEFAVVPLLDRRTKAGKIAFEEFMQEAGDRTVITQEQFEQITAMTNNVVLNKYAQALLKGEHEQSMYGVDELTKERIKTRPDSFRIIADRLIITDLKSCRSALTEDFIRDCVKYSYDLQAYMYCYNASQTLNIPVENIDFVFIAVSKTEPYLVNILQADEYVLQRGEALFREYIGKYHYCKETGDWFGLNGQDGIINNLTLPTYLLKNIEN